MYSLYTVAIYSLGAWLIKGPLPLDVSAALMREFESGTTLLPAKGGYSNADKTMIYFVVNRFQISRLQSIVHTIDPKAFMTISEVADIFKSQHDKV